MLRPPLQAEREAREAAGRPPVEKWRKKWFTYFRDPTARRILLVTAEEKPEGWLAWNFIPTRMDAAALRQWRIGTARIWPPRDGEAGAVAR
jgi:hypothetical protein